MQVNAKITSKNQTTLPAPVREALGVGPGDRLRYILSDDGRVTMEKDGSSLADLTGIVDSDIELADDELRDAIARARRKLGGA